MTATLPYSLLWSLSALTHVDFTLAAHQSWSSVVEFRQRSIKIELHVRGSTSDLKTCLIPQVIDELRSDAESHVFFVNFRLDVRVCSAALEDALSDKLMREGVLSVHGHMDKVKKLPAFGCSPRPLL